MATLFGSIAACVCTWVCGVTCVTGSLVNAVAAGNAVGSTHML
jgi:hypothetical protein